MKTLDITEDEKRALLYDWIRNMDSEGLDAILIEFLDFENETT